MSSRKGWLLFLNKLYLDKKDKQVIMYLLADNHALMGITNLGATTHNRPKAQLYDSIQLIIFKDVNRSCQQSNIMQNLSRS